MPVVFQDEVGRHERVLAQILSGMSDASIRFEDLRWVLLRLGFGERIRGSHHVFTRSGIHEILNLQARGHQAKPYQVKQVRQVLLRYKLGGDDGE
jgi:hypothetical protein